MKFKFGYLTVPVMALVFLTCVTKFFSDGPMYCWMVCLQPEISCLATVSFSFGLVPATILAASSAISGCLAASDMCELSCAKRSNLQPFSMKGNISDSCEIFRNGTKIKPIEIKSNWRLANPFNLDADCHELPEPTTTVPPPTVTTSSIDEVTMHPPHVGFPKIPNRAPAQPEVTTSSSSAEFKHPVVHKVNPPPE